MGTTQPAFTRSKVTIEMLKQGMSHWRRSGVFIVNVEHIYTPCSSVSIVNFEQVNAGWAVTSSHLSNTITASLYMETNYG